MTTKMVIFHRFLPGAISALQAHEIVFLSKLENSGENEDLSTRVNGEFDFIIINMN